MDSRKRLDILVRRCQKGNCNAWDEVFVEFQPRLRYYLRCLDHSGDLVDDILQDVWVKAIDKIGSLRDPRAFVAWLYRIARNELYSRSRVKDPFVELSDEQVAKICSEAEPAFTAEDGEQIHRALARLTPYQREVLTLNFMEALSYQQIAKILDINPGTVRSRIFNAKKALQQVLEKNHG